MQAAVTSHCWKDFGPTRLRRGGPLVAVVRVRAGWEIFPAPTSCLIASQQLTGTDPDSLHNLFLTSVYRCNE
ncbi:hypothetical protein EON63_03285 [archaeon]|nr:MAG: hypothetical protein EON63_03285 [archaeon]